MSNQSFLGIDPGDGRQPFTFAVLDSDRAILALGSGPMQSVLAYAAGLPPRPAAVSGPLSFNLGWMAQAERRAALDTAPKDGAWTELRVAEYVLALREAPVSHTPSGKGYCAKSIRRAVDVGCELRERLGYGVYGQEEGPRLLLEAQAEACYWSLLGVAPFAAGTLEGRLQRQLVLHSEKLPLPDPMDFFEEVTRFKLLKGILPVKDIYSQAELNALVAAYTAWLAVNVPERVEAVGGGEEGDIWLPIKG